MTPIGTGSVLLNGGSFCPLEGMCQYLGTFLLITTGKGGCYWHLMGRGKEEAAKYPTMHRAAPVPAPTAKSILALSANSAKVENLHARGARDAPARELGMALFSYQAGVC